MANERASDLRKIRRTELRRDRFVKPYSRAFNTVINKQIGLLKPYYGEIALGIVDAGLVVDRLFDPTSYESLYYRLYMDVGDSASKWTRDDLEPKKYYMGYSVKQSAETLQEQFAAITAAAANGTPMSVIEGVQQFLARYGGQRIVTLNNTTKELALRVIRDILQQGAEQGLSVDEIGRLLERQVPQRMRTYAFRGGLIARTEVLSAYNIGEMRQVQDLDVQVKKYWMARLDGRERLTHGDAYLTYRDNPIDKYEDFLVGGSYMAHPGDPSGGAANVINCRCVLGYSRP